MKSQWHKISLVQLGLYDELAKMCHFYARSQVKAGVEYEVDFPVEDVKLSIRERLREKLYEECKT
jgi:hypothetical protein